MRKFNVKELVLAGAALEVVEPSVIRKELCKILGVSQMRLYQIENIEVASNRTISVEQSNLIENYFSGKLKRKVVLEVRREEGELGV